MGPQWKQAISEIVVATQGLKPWTPCSAIQELNNDTIASPNLVQVKETEKVDYCVVYVTLL